jgi:Fur family ferric uptake transcriptional regulator
MAGKHNLTGPPTSAWIERAEAELRAAGYRSSKPRSSVLEIIGGQNCVLTAHEIGDEMKRKRGRVGIATIYRTLEILDELKLVQKLDVGGSTHYEPALPGGAHHHHHFVCDECGKVSPFEDEGLERAIEKLGKRLKHPVREHDVILRGICKTCA